MNDSTPKSQLRDRLERIYSDTLKKSHEARAEQLELGLTAMLQAAQQAASPIPTETRDGAA